MVRIFEAFAGYGSQAMALKRIGIDFEVVGISEIDRYAIQAYNAVHGEVNNFGDICNIDWDNVPTFDLFTYSFPCTDISSAGQQKGLSKDSGTRSSLLWECEKAIEIKRPKYLLMENVKALVGRKFIGEFREWQNILTKLGYANYTKVLNAKDYGIPQNRERVFMVSILGDEWFNFPAPIKLDKCLADVLEEEMDEKYYLSQELVDGFLKHRANSESKGRGFKFEPRDVTKVATCISTQAGARQTDNFIDMIQVGNLKEDRAKFTNPNDGRVYSPNGLSPCINTYGGGGREPKILGYTRDNKGKVSSYHEKDIANTLHTSSGSGGNTDQFVIGAIRGRNPNNPTSRKSGEPTEQMLELNTKGTSNCLTTAQKDNVVCGKTYIRKLTPRECFRLMGVSEEDIDIIQKAGISNTQQYRMAGNSIVVGVLEAIFEQMFYHAKQNRTLFG